MPANKYSISITPDVEARLPNADSRSGSINRGLDRYAELIERTPLPEFTPSEWGLVMDACRGTWWEPAANIAALWMGVDDALDDGLSEKWGVDGIALVKRLKGLSFAEELRIVHELEGGFRDSR